MRVVLQRLQELKSMATAHKSRTRAAIRAFRRQRRKSSITSTASASRRGSITDSTVSWDSEADSSDDEQLPGPGEPGEAERGTLSKFKVSFSLKDAILPQVTADPAESVLYRRERAEKAARPSPPGFHSLSAVTAPGWCSARQPPDCIEAALPDGRGDPIYSTASSRSRLDANVDCLVV